jgi:hypothetical protein
VSSLQEINDRVEQSPQSFSDCTINVSGEIQARTRSAIFALSKL